MRPKPELVAEKILHCLLIILRRLFLIQPHRWHTSQLMFALLYLTNIIHLFYVFYLYLCCSVFTVNSLLLLQSATTNQLAVLILRPVGVCFGRDDLIVTVLSCVLIAPRRTMPSSSLPCPQLPKSRECFPMTWPTWSGDCGVTAAYRVALQGRESTSSTTRQHSECALTITPAELLHFPALCKFCSLL